MAIPLRIYVLLSAFFPRKTELLQIQLSNHELIGYLTYNSVNNNSAILLHFPCTVLSAFAQKNQHWEGRKHFLGPLRPRWLMAHEI